MSLNLFPVKWFLTAFFFLAIGLMESLGTNSSALAWQAPDYEYDDVCELQTVDNYTPLMRAVREGQSVREILALLRSGKAGDINVKNSLGTTALHYAVVCNPHPEVTALLLERGADPEARTYFYPGWNWNFTIYPDDMPLAAWGSVPVLAAHHAQSPEVIRVLQDAGVSFAPYGGCEVPLDPGACPGRSPVLFALGNSNIDILKYLMDNNLGWPESLGEAAPDEQYAYLLDEISGRSFRPLKQNIGFILSRTSPAVLKARPWGVMAMKAYKKSLAAQLFEHGADPNAADQDDVPPIHYVYPVDNEEGLPLLRLLIAKGADVNAPAAPGRDSPYRGRTAMMGLITGHQSVDWNSEDIHPVRLEMLATLLLAGADVNLVDDDGRTALIYAAVNKPAFLEPLLKAGADPNSRGLDNKSALDIILEKRTYLEQKIFDRSRYISLLTGYGATWAEPGYFGAGKCVSYSAQAARRGNNAPEVSLLLDRDLPRFTIGHKQEFLMDILTQSRCSSEYDDEPEEYRLWREKNDLDLVRLALVKAGSDPVAATHCPFEYGEPPCGHTFLMIAAHYDWPPDILRLLIDTAADKKSYVNARHKQGASVLHFWASSDEIRVPVLELLLEYGADINARTGADDGRTPLMYLFDEKARCNKDWWKNGQLERAVRAMLVHGADLEAKDNKGKTARQYLREAEKAFSVTLLP